MGLLYFNTQIPLHITLSLDLEFTIFFLQVNSLPRIR